MRHLLFSVLWVRRRKLHQHVRSSPKRITTELTGGQKTEPAEEPPSTAPRSTRYAQFLRRLAAISGTKAHLTGQSWCANCCYCDAVVVIFMRPSAGFRMRLVRCRL